MSEQLVQVEQQPLEEKKADGIEMPKTKGHPMDVGPSTLSVEIPCGYIDKDGVVHSEMVFREMKGKEEDILAGKGAALPRMNRILANCLLQFGSLKKEQFEDAVAELSANDRMVALITLRRISLGDYYDVQLPCPDKDCKATSSFGINLSELEIIPMADRHKRNRSDVLKSGKVIHWHIMSSKDEAWLTKMKKRSEDVLTLAMLARVDAVDEVKLERETKDGLVKAMEILQDLSIRERGEARRLFLDNEGNVDIEVNFTCPSCYFEWKADMPVGQPSFFFPSGT